MGSWSGPSLECKNPTWKSVLTQSSAQIKGGDALAKYLNSTVELVERLVVVKKGGGIYRAAILHPSNCTMMRKLFTQRLPNFRVVFAPKTSINCCRPPRQQQITLFFLTSLTLTSSLSSSCRCFVRLFLLAVSLDNGMISRFDDRLTCEKKGEAS